MSGGGQESYLAQCPFYHRDKNETLVCEGVEEDSTINLVMSNKEKRKGYQSEYCNANWQNCLIARVLLAKWEEEEKTG